MPFTLPWLSEQRWGGGVRQAQEPLRRRAGCQVSPGTWVTWRSPHPGLEE